MSIELSAVIGEEGNHLHTAALEVSASAERVIVERVALVCASQKEFLVQLETFAIAGIQKQPYKENEKIQHISGRKMVQNYLRK